MQAGLTERLKRNLLSEAAFRSIEEYRVRALPNGPADELPYSGSASDRLATIDDGSTPHRDDGYDVIESRQRM